jgi:hypothetical protein
VPWGVLEERTARLLQACRDEDLSAFAAALQAIVPEWRPGEGLARSGSSKEIPVQEPG